MQTKPRNFKGALTRRACRGDVDTSSRHLFYTHSPHGMQVLGFRLYAPIFPLIQKLRTARSIQDSIANAGIPPNFKWVFHGIGVTCILIFSAVIMRNTVSKRGLAPGRNAL